MFDSEIPLDYLSAGPFDEPEVPPWLLPLEEEPEEPCLPAGLDNWEPGPVLAAVLAAIDLDRLSEEQRVTVLRARQRLQSHQQAAVWEAMVALADSYRSFFPNDPEAVWRCATAEIQAALRLTRRAAETALEMAEGLWDVMPAVAQALSAGKIDPPRARVLLFDTLHLGEQTAREVSERLLEAAPRLTTAQLRERIRRHCITADPQAATNRFQHAHTERRVVLDPTVDGTADLLLLGLSPDTAQAALRHLDSIARQLDTADESRTLGQLRADVAADLLTGRHRVAPPSRRSSSEPTSKPSSDSPSSQGTWPATAR